MGGESLLPWTKSICAKAKKIGYEDIIVVCGKAYRPFRRAIKGALVAQAKDYEGKYDSELLMKAFRFLPEDAAITIVKEGVELSEGDILQLKNGESILVGEADHQDMGVCCDGEIAHSINAGIGFRYIDAVTLKAKRLVDGRKLCLMEIARNALLEKSLVAIKKSKD